MIRALPEFTAWIERLKDATVRGVIVARIKRIECGLMDDVQPVGDGVSELRIHLGAGWRVYSKRTQKQDIKRARALAALLKSTEEML